MLTIENLTKAFVGHDLPVLNKLNLSIKAGEFVVILGSNGSGKSTLLKCISGEYKSNSGKIILNDKDVTNKKIYQRARDISFVGQDTTKGTAIDMTVLENMCLSMNRGIKSLMSFYDNKRNLAQVKIDELGINFGKILDKQMSVLSGGQRQSIATLMVFSPTPELLLLDEHTSALDPRSSHLLMEYTNNQIKKNNITTIMVTHNIEDAIKYGNRLLIMDHGNIIYDAGLATKQKLSSTDIFKLLQHNGDFNKEKCVQERLI